MNLEDVARIVHEANRAYCIALGDDSQVDWDVAPDWQKESAIEGVKIKIINPGMTASQQHDGWLAFKAAAGWKYGPVKDEQKLEHPCMVAYHDLPQDQKLKDALFGGIVTTFADDVEWEGSEGGDVHASGGVEVSTAVNS